jgi:hypothetical protein
MVSRSLFSQRQLKASCAGVTSTKVLKRSPTGAKAACEAYGHPKDSQVARGWDWHGTAHLKGASNEPARGAAMTSGPQLTNSLLRRA